MLSLAPGDSCQFYIGRGKSEHLRPRIREIKKVAGPVRRKARDANSDVKAERPRVPSGICPLKGGSETAKFLL